MGEAKRPRMLWLFFVLSTLLQQTSATGWTLLLRQTYGAGWFTYSDWYRNAHNPDAELFSRLGDIESFRGSDNTFHFHLWYPELGAGNEWKQTSNPMAVKQLGGTPSDPLGTSKVESLDLDQKLFTRWNCMSGMKKSSRWGRSFSPVWFFSQHKRTWCGVTMPSSRSHPSALALFTKMGFSL